jgi:hypothetical protein
MAWHSHSKKAVLCIAALAAAAAAAGLLLQGGRGQHNGLRDGDPAGAEQRAVDGERAESNEPATPDKPFGFRQAAEQSGITFRMAFLPGEQGEKFKINLYDHGCGVVVGDYDGDGHDDIYLLNQLGPNALYKNRGDGTFLDATATARVGLGDRICVGATFADYDNDGDQDLYVTSTRGGNVLFQNQGNGTFRDVTDQAGLTLVAHAQTAAFFDYDNDGYLDLLVTNTAEWTLEFDEDARYFRGMPSLWELAASPKEYNVLYHNNRDGTFSDATEEAGVKGLGWGGDVAIFDFDDDGRIDLFVTNMFGRNQLYRNGGNGKFSDVTQKTLGRTSWGAIGSKALDYNNDGKLDLFVVDMHSDMWVELRYSDKEAELNQRAQLIKPSERRKYLYVTGPSMERSKSYVLQEKKFADSLEVRYEEVLFGNTMFKALADGGFEETSDRANLETFWPWGIATGDFDNDGHEDVFLPSGMGYPYFYWPSSLLMNQGDETFAERARSAGIEPPARGTYLEQPVGGRPAARSSRCAATADFNGDGRLDLIVNNFNDRPYYFQNQFPQQNFIAFRLHGSRSNRDAVGAVLRAYVGAGVMTRQVHAAGGYLSQSSQTVHFGLGRRSKIDRVEIRWPRGSKQVIDAPEINKLHQLTEPDE